MVVSEQSFWYTCAKKSVVALCSPPSRRCWRVIARETRTLYWISSQSETRSYHLISLLSCSNEYGKTPVTALVQWMVSGVNSLTDNCSFPCSVDIAPVFSILFFRSFLDFTQFTAVRSLGPGIAIVCISRVPKKTVSQFDALET